ncbi:MAG TPA: TetR/AcrR family transcriptional regulator [Steroidobacteraceae bacterium]|jgi:AcrR family transcriptional regulator
MADDTRSRIVFAAMELFWEKGYASTSIQDVLKRSAANSGSLYHFFPGKQDLLLAVLQTYRSGIDEMLLRPAWGHIKDPIERIFALLARYRELVVQTECFYGCPIGSLALELHEPDPAVRELLAANFLAWTEAVQRCIVEAGERLPRAINSRELAEFVLTTMEGAVMQSRTFRDVSYFDRSVSQLRAYFDLLSATASAASDRGIGPRKRRRRTRSTTATRK